MAINEATFQQFLDKMLDDAGAAMGIGLVLLGDKLGLYKALAAAGPLTSSELASRTGTAARYVREWAAAQAAGGYINFDSATERFSISPEQALILADENGPAFFPAIFEIAVPRRAIYPRLKRRSAPAEVLDGMSTSSACSAARRNFFARATRCIWCRNGSLHWKASRKGSNTARRSQMLGAVMAHRPFCWPRHFRSRNSQGLTITNHRS